MTAGNVKPIGPGDRVRHSDGREAICSRVDGGVVYGLECRKDWPWPVAPIQWVEHECTRLASGRERPEKRGQQVQRLIDDVGEAPL